MQPFEIVNIEPSWVLEPETLGSKKKFWFRPSVGQRLWLFKYAEENTGQHWAEKVAEQLALALQIPHAKFELAQIDGKVGVASPSFMENGWNLYHGNQILAGNIAAYDPTVRFRQSDHTLPNIFAALAKAIPIEPDTFQIQKEFCRYLILDALIGNTDRHHENWGILAKQHGGSLLASLAPTFDHASSLGRELRDVGPKKSRERLLTENRVGSYSEQGRGAIYWNAEDKHGLSPLELIRRASQAYPGHFQGTRSLIETLGPTQFEEIVNRVPAQCMSNLARTFAVQLLSYNVGQLMKVLL